MSAPAHHAEGGLTLMEVMVALALFAIIAGTGFTLLDGVLRVGERTDGRLERLAEVQRAMHILTADIEQATPAPVIVVAADVAFRRSAPAGAAGDLAVRHGLAGGAWVRTLGEGADARRQILLSGVSGMTISGYTAGRGWTALTTPTTEAEVADARRPEAVAVEITLVSPDAGLSGQVRRVVRVPAAPAALTGR